MILLIDNYDSFTYNLYQYIGTFTPDIRVVRNDAITIGEIENMQPERIVLSPGSKSPKEAGICMDVVKHFYNKIPILGICLGHQPLELANGAKTEKLKYGHRGGNQPVKDLALDRTFITSQNHGYAVVSGSVPAEAGEVSHVNGNDGTCEGVRYHNAPAFTVQFHPEACGGPKDTAYLFDEFIELMEGKKSCR